MYITFIFVNHTRHLFYKCNTDRVCRPHKLRTINAEEPLAFGQQPLASVAQMGGGELNGQKPSPEISSLLNFLTKSYK